MDKGSVLIFLNGPFDRLEFSLNGVFGRTASKFQGFHSIPSSNDFHFVSYRISGGSEGGKDGEGAFVSLILNLNEARVLVFEWSQEDELFKLKTEEKYEPEMIESLLKYPGLISYKRFMEPEPEPEILWNRFTRFITKDAVSRIFSGVRSSGSDSVFEVTPMLESHHSLLKGLKEETEIEASLNFTKILSLMDFAKISEGIYCEQVTKCAMDRTLIFEYLNIKISDLLSELQISFLLLTFAQNFEGFEQWIDIVSLLLQSFELAMKNQKEYKQLLDVIQEHLEMCPDDFFSGLMNENKLYKLISGFLLNTEGAFFNYEKFYEKKFGWVLENEEDGPVIIETE